jgi:hypothetical protein
MYPHTNTAIAPLEMFLSHHFFIPVYQPCSKVSVQLSRPPREFTNVNYVASAIRDVLFSISVLR